MPEQDKKRVTRSIPAFIARTQFGQIFERISEEKERLLVTEHREAKVVIFGVEASCKR